MRASKRRDILAPCLLTAAALALWAVMHCLLETEFLGPAFYNTYTRQALAWREGLLHLPEDVPYLELAVYQDAYYVSFPPVPSLVLLPLTFLFGEDTPDNLLVKLYTLAACLLIYQALKRAGYSRLSSCLLAFLFCFASSLLPMTLDGAVWYHAQVLAFSLIVAAICLMALDRPTPALFLYALSVGCRPFHALYAAPLFFTWWTLHRRDGFSLKGTVRPLIPGVAMGLCVAAGLGLYNAARFGNPLEFGHNYLPEFSFQGGVQFSLSHVWNNLETFLFGLPVDLGDAGVQVKSFGYSMLLACPALLLMLIGFAVDIIKKRLRWEKTVVLLTCLLHAFLLLLHRTFGGYQLGARYAVDLMPYAFFYLLLTPEKKKAHWAEVLMLLLTLGFTVWGTTQVHI